nr:MAG TPA: hypothetical protein [Caudoviricetes sp.]
MCFHRCKHLIKQKNERVLPAAYIFTQEVGAPLQQRHRVTRPYI